MEGLSDFRKFLVSQLEARKRRAPLSSLRSFSAKIGVSPASLCQIISGKRGLTRKMATRIAKRLGLTPGETRTLIHGALVEKFRSLSLGNTSLAPSEIPTAGEMNLDEFRQLSDWYYGAILSLIDVKGAKIHPEWFARRLGITTLEAHQAILRLMRLGFIVNDGVRFKTLTKGLKTPSNVSDAAVQKYPCQNLKKAGEALN